MKRLLTWGIILTLAALLCGCTAVPETNSAAPANSGRIEYAGDDWEELAEKDYLPTVPAGASISALSHFRWAAPVSSVHVQLDAYEYGEKTGTLMDVDSVLNEGQQEGYIALVQAEVNSGYELYVCEEYEGGGGYVSFEAEPGWTDETFVGCAFAAADVDPMEMEPGKEYVVAAGYYQADDAESLAAYDMASLNEDPSLIDSIPYAVLLRARFW